MQVAHLKAQLANLPDAQFTAAWKAIESIQQSLGDAGETALLVLQYVQAKHEEEVAKVLAGLSQTVDILKEQNLQLHQQLLLTHQAATAKKPTSKKKSK